MAGCTTRSSWPKTTQATTAPAFQKTETCRCVDQVCQTYASHKLLLQLQVPSGETIRAQATTFRRGSSARRVEKMWSCRISHIMEREPRRAPVIWTGSTH